MTQADIRGEAVTTQAVGTIFDSIFRQAQAKKIGIETEQMPLLTDLERQKLSLEQLKEYRQRLDLLRKQTKDEAEIEKINSEIDKIDQQVAQGPEKLALERRRVAATEAGVRVQERGVSIKEKEEARAAITRERYDDALTSFGSVPVDIPGITPPGEPQLVRDILATRPELLDKVIQHVTTTEGNVSEKDTFHATQEQRLRKHVAQNFGFFEFSKFQKANPLQAALAGDYANKLFNAGVSIDESVVRARSKIDQVFGLSKNIPDFKKKRLTSGTDRDEVLDVVRELAIVGGEMNMSTSDLVRFLTKKGWSRTDAIAVVREAVGGLS